MSLKQVSSVEQLRHQVAEWRQNGERIGFVPTMGNLHEGHLSLVREASMRTDRVVVSIFVNPMQFGANEDLDAYPRTEAQDCELLAACDSDLVFLPTVETIYPVPMDRHTRVEVPGLSEQLCGASRPGHFAGVSTIVAKLFNLVQPDVAVFGEKDFQQLMIIRTMVRDLAMPIEIIGAPIVRAEDGLALSSRNGYLTVKERTIAPALRKVLHNMSESIHARNIALDDLCTSGREMLEKAGFRVDYLEVRNLDNLMKVTDVSTEPLIILAAVFLGKTRLIDNLPVGRYSD